MPEPSLTPAPVLDSAELLAPTLVLSEDDDQPDEPSPLEALPSEFDPRHREDFVGMLYLGKLEEECRVVGHTFLLETPDQTLRLAMGPLHKPYVNTLSGERAWESIVVAAFLKRIDSEERPQPLRGGGPELRDTWAWVTSSIHSQIVISKLFEKCLLLDARVREILEQLDGLGKP